MEAVVFDMDGVIFDSERLVIDLWKELGEKYHFQNAQANAMRCLGTNKTTSKNIFLKYYGNRFPYDVYAAELSSLYHQRYDGHLPLKKGVRHLLAWLSSHHYLIALASSTREKTVRMQLENAHLMDYFGVIVTGDQVTHSKPDPEIYLTACQRLKVTPDQAYGIEDSYNGIRSCLKAGLEPIMVPDLLAPDEEMKKSAKVILKDLDEVCGYIEKQSRQ